MINYRLRKVNWGIRGEWLELNSIKSINGLLFTCWLLHHKKWLYVTSFFPHFTSQKTHKTHKTHSFFLSLLAETLPSPLAEKISPSSSQSCSQTLLTPWIIFKFGRRLGGGKILGGLVLGFLRFYLLSLKEGMSRPIFNRK